MASAVRQERPDRDGSCFSRAARAIRRALSRICGDTSPSVPTLTPSSHHHAETEELYSRLNSQFSPPQLSEYYGSCLSRRETCKSSAVRRSSKHGLKLGYKKKKHLVSSPVPEPDYEMVHAPRRDTSWRDTSWRDSYGCLNKKSLVLRPIGSVSETCKSSAVRRSSKHGLKLGYKKKKHLVSSPVPEPDYEMVHAPRRDTSWRDSYGCLNKKSLALRPISSVSMFHHAPIRDRVIQDSADTEGSKEQEEFKMMSVRTESESGDVSDALVTVEAVVTAENYSATNAQPTRPHLQMSSDPGSSKRDSSCLSRSHSVPSLSQISSEKNKTFTRSQSLPDMLIKSGFEEFIPDITVHTDPTGSDHETSEVNISVPPPDMLIKSSFEEFTPDYGAPIESDDEMSEDLFIIRRPVLKYSKPLWEGFGRPCLSNVKKYKKCGINIASVTGYPVGTSELMQIDTGEMDTRSRAGPSTIQLSSSDDDDSDSAEIYGKRARMDWMSGYDEDTTSVLRSHVREGYVLTTPSQAQGQNILIRNRKETDDGGFSFDNSSSTFSRPSCSQSTAPTVYGPPCPKDRPVVLQDSTVCTEGSRAQDDDVLIEMEMSDTALNLSVTNNQSTHSHLQLSSSDPGWSERDSSCLSRSHSVPSLSQTTSPENKTFTRSQSLPDMLLKSSFEEFTPDIIDDEDDETYRFQCSCPGLYQCSVTGLVFHMEGEGDVVYRTVPWDRRLLAQHHKQPAGPLFDIKCLQQSVCQLHLPHCEIRSTGGCEFLSVAHVNDEGIQFIVPQKITETHVIINITGFSGFGNVKDEDSPPDPVRALVLLFYRPPADPDPDPESLLNVLLLPVNIVLRDVLRTRKKLVGDEIYIETSSHCKLRPKQEYTLSTCPEDDSVLVQPTEAEFDCDNYDNYLPSFQVILEKVMKHIKLFLRENKSSKSVWERRVCLSSTAVKRSCGPSALNLPPNDRLLDIRSSFIDGISGPVLKSLLDKLLEKTVLADSERESADEIKNHRDKARFVVDTVRKKGEAASSEMIEFLCEVDPFLCEHLGLI